MHEDVSEAGLGVPDDLSVEDQANPDRASGPPVGVLLGLLAESIALVALGLWVLVIG